MKQVEHLRYLYQELTYRRRLHHPLVGWTLLLYAGCIVLITRPNVVAQIYPLILVVIWLAAGIGILRIIISYCHYVRLMYDIYRIYKNETTIENLVSQYFGLESSDKEQQRSYWTLLGKNMWGCCSSCQQERQRC